MKEILMVKIFSCLHMLVLYRHSSISVISISAILDLMRLIILSYFPPLSNLDLRGFRFSRFFMCPHINSVDRGMPVIGTYTELQRNFTVNNGGKIGS